jgi:hypothetical protein
MGKSKWTQKAEVKLLKAQSVMYHAAREYTKPGDASKEWLRKIEQRLFNAVMNYNDARLALRECKYTDRMNAKGFCGYCGIKKLEKRQLRYCKSCCGGKKDTQYPEVDHPGDE